MLWNLLNYLLVIEEFDLDVTKEELRTYVESELIPKGIMAHQLIQHIDDSDTICAIRTALRVLNKDEVGGLKSTVLTYMMTDRLILTVRPAFFD